MRAQTTKSVRIQFVSLILAGLISMPVHAEVIPGRWEKVSALEMASSITVDLKNGNRIQGQFRGLSSSDLELLSPAGWAVIPRMDIQTITLPSKDGVGDGAWKGAVVGGVVVGSLALIATVLGVSGESNTDTAFVTVGVGAIGAGIGAGIGVAADAATTPEDIVVYKAPGAPSTFVN